MLLLLYRRQIMLCQTLFYFRPVKTLAVTQTISDKLLAQAGVLQHFTRQLAQRFRGASTASRATR